MPNLLTGLTAHDLGVLRIIGAHWGVEDLSSGAPQLRESLASCVLDRNLLEEVVQALPDDAVRALADMARHTGRVPWVRFEQQHGVLRAMGAARREREKPHENPASPVEILYYRGFLFRAFFDTEDGPLEFAYIPDDVLPLLPRLEVPAQPALGRPAAETDHAHRLAYGDQLLDQATTLLAATRLGDPGMANIPAALNAFLRALLAAAGILDPGGTPDVEAVRSFLETGRGQALSGLVRTWMQSPQIDDLRLVPALQVDGGWDYGVVRVRSYILGLLEDLPDGIWWSLPGFRAAVRESRPEFLRPSGMLEGEYVRERRSGAYLRGPDHWDSVEGAYIGWLLAGPLHWLGVVELAGPQPDPEIEWTSGRLPPAFRLTRGIKRMRSGDPVLSEPEDQPFHVRSDGRIGVPRLSPRAARYLLARFCEWEPPVTDEYRYRPTPSSLTRAADQGLNVSQLIALLAKHAHGIPPNVTQALKNWQVHGQAARIAVFPVLRVPSPEALEALRKSRAARFLGDRLGPAAVALRPGSEQRVLAALVELGYLGEIVE